MPGDFAAAVIEAVAAADAARGVFDADRISRPYFFGRKESMGGGARGFMLCRACLYAERGKLLVRRRAIGRHLRMHVRESRP